MHGSADPCNTITRSRISEAEDVTSSLCNDLRSTAVHRSCKSLKTNSEPLHVVFWGWICFGKPHKAQSELLHLLFACRSL